MSFQHSIRLRFETEVEAITALAQFRAGDVWLTASHDHALDPIGPLVTTPAVLDPDTGEIVTPAVIDERWHANLRTSDTALVTSLAAYRVRPTTMLRRWL